jgi:phosphoribosyl 1,2-cyclic phosphodiesterase
VEANHDVNMLQVGRYPYYLKRRILGREGHLSNERCAQLIDEVATERTRKVYLGHLSKENNYEKLAYETVRVSLHNQALPLEVARRDMVSTVTSI